MRHYTIKAVSGLFACMICLLGSAICPAQTEPNGIGGIEFNTIGMAPTNVSDPNDWESGAEMGYCSAGVKANLYDASAGYDNISFSWDNADRLPFGNGKEDPWGDIHIISLEYGWSDMFNENWGYFASVGGASGFEKEIDDSFGVRGVAGFVYLIPEWRLMFKLGGGAYWNPVETKPIPVFGIEWTGRDETGWAISAGWPSRVAYRFTPDMSLSVILGMQNAAFFRLADDSVAEKKGYVGMGETCHALAFDFSPIEHCSVTLGGGVSVHRGFKIHDNDGENGREYGLNPSAGLFCIVNYEF